MGASAILQARDRMSSGIMKAGFGLSIAATIAALAAIAAGAQTTGSPAPATPAPSQQQPAPPAGTVGPRELRDFSIGGTATQPAPAAQEPSTAAQPPSDGPPTASAPRVNVQPAPRAAPPSAPQAAREDDPAPLPDAIQALPVDVPSTQPAFVPTPSEVVPALPPPDALSGETRSLSLWPWLVAGLAIAIGAGLMLLRQRQRRALAGYGLDETSALSATAPPAQPMARTSAAAEPARPAAVAPSPPAGIVSTRLRPWVELEFTPTRCILEQSQATVEFLVKIVNSGNAVARDIRIDTMLFNAGPTQDEDIGAFFAYPPTRGETLEALAPMTGLETQGSVGLPIDRLQVLEAGGRRLFVPLIGFNLSYRWNGGEGQTSRSFLLGREGEGEKMAPFRADLGPRVFRGLGARELQSKVRR